MASIRKVGKKWSARIRGKSFKEVNHSGFRTKGDAKQWADSVEDRLRGSMSISGLGPYRTTLAIGLRDYAHIVTAKQGGCVQALCKINKYLRAANLKILKATKIKGGRTFGSGPDGLPSELIQTVDTPLYHLTEHVEVKVFTGPKQTGFAKRQVEITAMGARTQQYRVILARMKVSDILPAHLTELMRLMEEDGYSGATRRQELAIISSFLAHAMREWNWPLTKNYALSVKWPKGTERDRIMSDEESVRVADCLASHTDIAFVRFVLLSMETAMRKGESLWTACWCDVNYKERVLKLPHAKTGQREVPLSPEAISMLQEMPQGNPTERIFNLTPASVDCNWKRLRQDAGTVDLRIHDLRHTSATMWFELLNGNLIKLKQITGHRTLKMLERYLHTSARKVAADQQAVEVPTMSARMRKQIDNVKSDEFKVVDVSPDTMEVPAEEPLTSPAAMMLRELASQAYETERLKNESTRAQGSCSILNMAAFRERKKLRESIPVMVRS